MTRTRGGQIKYVVELAKALIEHKDIEKVDLVTRLVADSRVDASYAEPIEELAPGVNIVRIECGPRRYLRKESLWPYLDSFVDNTVRYMRNVGRAPDLCTGTMPTVDMSRPGWRRFWTFRWRLRDIRLGV